ncbi:hypothetical protein KKH27_01745 [bacterium]|nr:hypothetical protein [bacterium]MBU1984159.1 hypothetical protein [bacterium]
MKTVLFLFLACVLLFAAVNVAYTIGCGTTWAGAPSFTWLDCLTPSITATSGTTYWMIVQAPSCNPNGVFGTRGGGALHRAYDGQIVFNTLCPQNLQIPCCEKRQWTGEGSIVYVHGFNNTRGGPEAKNCGPTGVTFSPNYYDCDME